MIIYRNRDRYISLYNTERERHRAVGLPDSADLPVPDWLWLERAYDRLYGHPKDESNAPWPPSDEALNTDEVRVRIPSVLSSLGEACRREAQAESSRRKSQYEPDAGCVIKHCDQKEKG